MEKLAEGLQRLGEEDLLNVVQLVHDHKTSDTYTKNDVESMCSYIVTQKSTLVSEQKLTWV